MVAIEMKTERRENNFTVFLIKKDISFVYFSENNVLFDSTIHENIV